MSRSQCFTIALLCLFLAAITPAAAQQFVQCQPYATSGENEVDLEVWNNFTPQAGHVQDTGATVGVTDQLQVLLVGRSASRLQQPRDFEGSRMEAIYRLAESGKLPMDPAVYVQYAKSDAFGAGAVGGRFILSRDLGSVNFTLNYGVCRSFEAGSSFGAEYGVGVGVPLSNSVSATVEYMKTADGQRALIHGVQVKLSKDIQATVGAAHTSDSTGSRFQPYGNMSIRF